MIQRKLKLVTILNAEKTHCRNTNDYTCQETWNRLSRSAQLRHTYLPFEPTNWNWLTERGDCITMHAHFLSRGHHEEVVPCPLFFYLNKYFCVLISQIIKSGMIKIFIQLLDSVAVANICLKKSGLISHQSCNILNFR